MKKNKSTIRETSYVTIRTKPLTHGRQSLYLDIYHNGRRTYEFLRLYLVADTGPEAQQQNKSTLAAATAIRNQRNLDIVQARGGIRTDTSSRMTLVEWLKTYRQLKAQNGQSMERATSVGNAIHHVIAYRGDKVRLCDIDEEYCTGFINYLAHAPSQQHLLTPRRIAITSANQYFAIFTSALNEAVRKKLIPVNPVNSLSREDRKPIRAPKPNRPYLTIDEVKTLVTTPCSHPQVKCAFLFSCFTGLRISDIRNLKWSNIQQRDGSRFLSITIQKTREPLTIKLNRQALRWMPKPEADDSHVFHLPPFNHNVCNQLRQWIAQTNIQKNICFHCARHTFATMELTLGADLYVVSKLLGHTSVSTTQIYADIVNKRREEAIELIDTAF
ncbi:MAG: site-specific integrase [Prevotella sp.]|nr:site-specific integrase [Prevotella sp.]